MREHTKQSNERQGPPWYHTSRDETLVFIVVVLLVAGLVLTTAIAWGAK